MGAYTCIVLRKSAASGIRFNRTPIQKLKSDGSLAATFAVQGLGDQFWSKDFFVTPDGKVFQVAYTATGEFYVFEFDADGSVEKRA